MQREQAARDCGNERSGDSVGEKKRDSEQGASGSLLRKSSPSVYWSAKLEIMRKLTSRASRQYCITLLQ
jgi:hypothetical protein